jgi:MFS family permease
MPRLPSLLLNFAHALDHLFLLIFATAVGAIAADFGIARWEDLMPWTAGAFVMFGLGSIPAGRLGDLWGRRRMMLLFFFGSGLSAIAAGLTQNPWQIAVALTVLGSFAAIYHPVGIPMLLVGARRPGLTIGFNGFAGNIGVALAAVSTGFLVEHFGWRTAFAVPGVLSIVAGMVFARIAPREATPPASRPRSQAALPRGVVLRALGVMVVTATAGGLIFNFTTNGNAQLLAERMAGIVADPGTLGLLLGAIYTVAAGAQVVVGRLIDRVPMKPLFFAIVATQALLFWLAAESQGWAWFVLAMLCMAFVFGAIPFNDALVVRCIDDSMRSRVSGMRLAISFTISSIAVWALGPLVKASGFTALQLGMAAIAAAGAAVVLLLPGDAMRASAIAPARASPGAAGTPAHQYAPGADAAAGLPVSFL